MTDTVEDPVSDQYVAGFLSLVQDLADERSAFKDLAPPDDPMHFDEGAFKHLKCQVLADPVVAQALVRYTKIAHCIEARKEPRPEVVMSEVKA
jgi:hypothetical protein